MASVDTDPNLQHLLLSHLRSWRDTTTNQSVSSLELQSLLDNQAAIGWDRCLEGWLSNQWASAQQCYHNILKSRRFGRRWVISIIKKLCDTAWDLWQHCNEILHHKETHISQEAPRLLRREVTQLFNGLSSSHLRQRDRYLLHLSLGSLQNKDKEYKEVWVQQARAALQAINHSFWMRQRRSQQTMRGMSHVMHRWLGRGQSNYVACIYGTRP